VDEEGKITDAILGEKVIPNRQYDYFFYLSDDPEIVSQNIPNYRVVNGQLSLVES
jgi:hypothetical protein